MRKKLFLIHIIYIIASIAILNQTIMASDIGKWTVQISIYSGRTNPEYQLDENEISDFKNMLETNTTKSARVTDDTLDKHEGRKIQYGKYIGDSYYNIILVKVTSDSNEYVELYEISGKYLRIYYDEGDASKLYKMKNKDIEEYLINLAIEKGAIKEGEEKIIRDDIQKRDKRDKGK